MLSETRNSFRTSSGQGISHPGCSQYISSTQEGSRNYTRLGCGNHNHSNKSVAVTLRIEKINFFFIYCIQNAMTIVMTMFLYYDCYNYYYFNKYWSFLTSSANEITYENKTSCLFPRYFISRGTKDYLTIFALSCNLFQHIFAGIGCSMMFNSLNPSLITALSNTKRVFEIRHIGPKICAF